MIKVTGEMPIGRASRFGTAGTTKAFDPRLGTEIEPSFGVATLDDVDDACTLALQAFRHSTRRRRSAGVSFAWNSPF